MSEPLSGEAGEEKYLSQEERTMVRRLLKFTEEYPDELGTYIKEFLKVNPPQVTATQVRGSRGAARFLAVEGSTSGFDSTTETTVFSYKIPGRSLAKSGTLTAKAIAKLSCADAGNTCSLRWKLNGSTIAQWDIDVEGMDGTQRPIMFSLELQNLANYALQFVKYEYLHQFTFSSQFEADFRQPALFTIDTAEDFTFSFTVDWASAGTQNYDHLWTGLSVFNPAGAG